MAGDNGGEIMIGAAAFAVGLFFVFRVTCSKWRNSRILLCNVAAKFCLPNNEKPRIHKEYGVFECKLVETKGVEKRDLRKLLQSNGLQHKSLPEMSLAVALYCHLLPTMTECYRRFLHKTAQFG